MDRARILIVGGGDAGRKIAWRLAAEPAVGLLILADRDPAPAAAEAEMIACCHDVLVDVRALDGTDPGAVRALLSSAGADLIVQCAALLSPWATIGVDHPVARALSAAGLGVQLPVQLMVLETVMAARAELGLATPVANLSLPDISHAVLATRDLAPTIGLGNVTIQYLRARAALRKEHAEAGTPDAPLPLLRLVGHHHQVYGVMQADPPADPADQVRVMAGEDALPRPELAYRGAPVAPGPVYNVITAAAALEVLRGLLPDAAPVRISAPAPSGRLGGYPVKIAPDGVTLDLPAGVDVAECESLHRRMTDLDGVAGIDPDGTVHFSDRAAAALAGFDDGLTAPLRPGDLAERAGRLLRLAADIPGS